MSKMITTNDGQNLYCAVEGLKSPIIFLHGWAMSGLYFQHQLNGLSESFRVLVPDLRGMGRSTPLNADTTKTQLTTYADDVDYLIRTEKLQDVTLVGWSFGAYVLWEYIEKYGTSKLAGNVVVEMADYLGDPSWAEQENESIEKKGYESYLREFLISMFHVPPEKDSLDNYLGESLRTSPELAKHLNTIMAQKDFRKLLPTVDIPTLLIYGQDELFFSETDKERTARAIRNCSMKTFAASKHCPFIEEYELFNQEIKTFIFGL